MVIPLITLIKISIPNTPFERIDFISIIVKLTTEVNLTKKELPQALFFYIFFIILNYNNSNINFCI